MTREEAIQRLSVLVTDDNYTTVDILDFIEDELGMLPPLSNKTHPYVRDRIQLGENSHKWDKQECPREAGQKFRGLDKEEE